MNASQDVTRWQPREIAWVVLVTGVVATALSAPFLALGVVSGDDAYWHLVYNTLFDEQLRGGQPYPRWLFRGNGGLGGPSFFFYGAIPSYLATLFDPLTSSVRYRLADAVLLATLASGIATYVWLRMSFGPGAALAAALVYMAHPYHINVDVYLRFAYAEGWSFVWMPIVLAATTAMARGSAAAWPIGAIAYGLFLASHPPSVLLFSCLLVPYIVALCWRTAPERRPRVARDVVTSLAVGVLLAGIYLVPALTTQDFASYTQIDQPFLVEHFVDFAAVILSGEVWRIFLVDGFDGDTRAGVFFWVIVVSVVVAVACIVLAAGDRKSRGDRFWLAFWSAVALVVVFAQTGASLPLWEFAKPLQRVQFPTRLLALMALALAPLVAAAAARFADRPRRIVVGLLFAAVLVAPLWIPTLKHVHDSYAHFDGDLGLLALPPETRPATVPHELAYSISDLGARTPRAALSGPQGRVDVLAWEPDGIRLAIATPSADDLTVGQLAYPGWTALASNGATPPIGVSPEGLLTVKVPAGSYRLSIRRERLDSERQGAALSALGLLLLVVGSVAVRRGLISKE